MVVQFNFNICNSSLGLAIPPRVRFLQKWKKAKEAKKKEKVMIAQTVVEDLNEKLKKSSDSEISDDEPEPRAYQSFVKDSYNFHDGNY